ncbi:MAG: HAMP domain-containing histidine kinase [Bacteroidia bacterium]|nr:HAMP domain-containing histidine kinase [Bacteroidia bacterium]
MELELERIQLKELCSEILDNLKFMDEFVNVKIRVEVRDDTAVYNDRMRLKIILNNLITNAIKFPKQLPGHEPMIVISAYNVNEATVISIEDNGEGIRPQVLSNIFEMFYRGNERSKGSGLGLYIAKETAERISGESQWSRYTAREVFSGSS